MALLTKVHLQHKEFDILLENVCQFYCTVWYQNMSPQSSWSQITALCHHSSFHEFI